MRFDSLLRFGIFRTKTLNMIKKTVLGMLALIAVIVVGFMFLLRGCLASYDERSAIAPALFFEKDGRAVVFIIVKYEKATSYSRKGGIVNKSVSTNYYIQVNDALTGVKLDQKKIRHHSDVKNYPISAMGKAGDKAWVFIGEPMAFDPFTLEKYADKSIIESKNPMLAGKMPEQRSYYKFNAKTGELFITATDGLHYSLSTSTLIATVVDEDLVTAEPGTSSIKELEKKKKALDDEDRAYYQRFMEFNRLYREQKISQAVYYDSTKYFNRRQDTITARQKQIRDAISALKDNANDLRDRERELENLNDGSLSYTDYSRSSDTINGQWYGLMTAADLEKRNPDFQYQPVYTETARNKLYTAATRQKDPGGHSGKLMVDEPVRMNDNIFLQGGFLLDKFTALPIHLKNKEGVLIVHRQTVGYKGEILVSRIDLRGNITWTLNTKLTEFLDWIWSGNRLIILGADNKELSSGEANLMMSIDLQNGSRVIHDYFTDKMRK